MPADHARLLVFNAGSSSLKFAVYDCSASATAARPSSHAGSADLPMLLQGELAGVGGSKPPRFSVRRTAGTTRAGDATRATPATAAVAAARPESLGEDADASHETSFLRVAQWLKREVAPGTITAIGHRIVHGGAARSAPARIDTALLAELRGLVPLAPLHQPQGLEGIRVAASEWPGVPQVACFDTAFHRSQPDVAQTFALPLELRTQGIRRYGFHGLSCEHVLQRLRELAPAVAAGRLLIAHLGSGSSLTAVADGRSVANTMGFTALDGLTMGTRCGNLDPGAILHLLRLGWDAARIEDLLYRRSGLLGLSGCSAEMHVLLEQESRDDAARFAVEHFVYRVIRETGSLAAAMGGIDAIVFTGGIGEHSATLRARIGAGMEWLGLELDTGANAAASGPRAATIAAPRSRMAAWVIAADEESVIAARTAALLLPG